jgi:hypothetical protein
VNLLTRLLVLLCACVGLAANAGGVFFPCPNGTPMKFAGAGSVALNYDRGNFGSRGNAQIAAIIDNARALWNNVGTSTVTISRGPDLALDVSTWADFAAPQGYTGLFPVFLDSTGAIIENLFGAGASNSVMSYTNIDGGYSDSEPCQTIRGYILLNGKASDVLGASDTALTVTVAREIGVLIGVGRTQLDTSQGLDYGKFPVMYPHTSRATADLHEDDIASVSALYPDASVNRTYGTVIGRFVLPDGTPVLGANLWTRNEATGALFSVVSDYLAQGDGAFKLLLPPGTYRLRAEAIDYDFWSVDHVGPHSMLRDSPSFQPPLYSGTTPMAPVTHSVQLNVVAGCSMDVTFRMDGSGGVNSTSCLPPVASELLDPAGVGISGPAAHFEWTAGVAVSERYLMVGTTRGGSDLYSGYQGSTLSRYLDNIPINGSTIYVRLMSYANGQWLTRDYSFVGPYIGCSPRFTNSYLTSPARDATFAGSTVTFTWTEGCDVTERYLAVASTEGGSDIYGAYQGNALSRTVTGIPTDGRTIYVAVSSWMGGAGWVTTFTTHKAYGSSSAPIVPAKSNLTTPAPGSTLSGSSVTFEWDAGTAVSERYLAIGSAAGASDLYSGYQGGALSRSVSALPTDGRAIHVTLSSWVNGGWQSSSAMYSAASGGAPPADPASVIISPAPNSLAGYPSATFTWTAGTGVTERYLMVGTTAGGSQIYAGYQGSALSRTVPAMPSGVNPIHVRLMSYIDGMWVVRSYMYIGVP